MTDNQIDRVRGRRASLYRTALDLEHALSSPAADVGLWSQRVSEAARSLVASVETHAAESEAPGEFLSNIATDAPHLANAAQNLCDEHPGLIDRSRSFVELVESSSRPPVDRGSAADLPHEVRERGLELLAALVRHRQRGADLMFLAYNEDLGSAG